MKERCFSGYKQRQTRIQGNEHKKHRGIKLIANPLLSFPFFSNGI
jgi:hypothetical protein